ncbi:MAG: HAD family phosphatase [Candidatus Poribacteria bacterium]|nr:HAD family phosphatase [Candidatus Poribacteria bacterium]
MTPLRAVFFDMDGLIIDTETPDFQAWHETLAEIGVDLPLETWLEGVGTFGAFDRFADALGVPADGREEIRNRKRVRYLDLIRREYLKTLPGFDALHNRFRDAGLTLAVVSTASRDWVDLILGELGILDGFDFTLSGSDVTLGKPHPDLYLLAAKKACARKSECLVFEDSVNGVLAAHRAEIPVVAVPNGITRQHDLSAATRIVLSLTDMDATVLAEMGFRLD